MTEYIKYNNQLEYDDAIKHLDNYIQRLEETRKLDIEWAKINSPFNNDNSFNTNYIDKQIADIKQYKRELTINKLLF